jgi:hypothetical protein
MTRSYYRNGTDMAMTLKEFNVNKTKFVSDVLDGILTERIKNNPHLIPHLMQCTIERFRELGIGGGHA